MAVSNNYPVKPVFRADNKKPIPYAGDGFLVSFVTLSLLARAPTTRTLSSGVGPPPAVYGVGRLHAGAVWPAAAEAVKLGGNSLPAGSLSEGVPPSHRSFHAWGSRHPGARLQPISSHEQEDPYRGQDRRAHRAARRDGPELRRVRGSAGPGNHCGAPHRRTARTPRAAR